MKPVSPPIIITSEGSTRRVGFELEYAGIDLPRSAALIQQAFGGTIVEETMNSYRVEDTPYGAFSVKLDSTWPQELSAKAAEQRAEDPGQETFETIAEKIVSPIVSLWLPNEIVSPPLPLDAIEQMDALCDALRANGAKGTASSPIYAFGLHLNPEMPDIPPERLKDYLAAFVLLQDWLKVKTEMDITRQLTTFARPFPVEYARIILQPGYEPSFAQLVDDYLEHNPTRNRALDMLPLFAYLDEPRVRAKVTDGRVRARPTFHYRLPNSGIDDVSWNFSKEWNLWVEVERLAEDHARRSEMARSYLAWADSTLNTVLGNWAQEATQWMDA